jgi:hypothetical protein
MLTGLGEELLLFQLSATVSTVVIAQKKASTNEMKLTRGTKRKVKGLTPNPVRGLDDLPQCPLVNEMNHHHPPRLLRIGPRLKQKHYVQYLALSPRVVIIFTLII